MITLWNGMVSFILAMDSWLSLAISIFNMLLLLWLGITIFFTAERRTWGLYLILSGMSMGCLFFTSHSMILWSELTRTVVAPGSGFWWRVGWIPVIVIPVLWYLVLLWYTGAVLPLRHRFPLLLMIVYMVVLLGLLWFTNALPSYEDVTVLYLERSDNLGGVPLLLLFYPPYVLVTLMLSVDTLHHPQPSQRMMGDLARARAHRWLIRVCTIMLVISMLVATFVYGVMFSAFHRVSQVQSDTFIQFVEFFDLIITLLIATMIIMLGRAVISYEIFTGKSLPRRGFQRLWRNAIIVCGSTAIFISFSILVRLPTLHSLLILSVILVTFFGLLSWRTFVHRDHLVKRLRPFTSTRGSGQYLFNMVCREMLQTEKACLVPMVPPLTSQPIYYQTEQPPPTLNWQELLNVQIMALSGSYPWVMPVWSTRGLMGLLFMGHKEDGGLYAREEIDAASVSLERIIELLIREELGMRVLQVERTRQMQQRIFDRHAQRVLHDEVLPDLHLAILGMDDSPARTALIDTHRKISDLMHNTPRIPAVQSHNIIEILQAIIHDEFSNEFDNIQWQGDSIFLVPDDLTREVVVHAAREIIRNAAKHGRGDDSSRRLCLTIEAVSPTILTITDNGVGQRQPWRKDNGGLALHSTMLAIVGGDLQVMYPAAGGTSIRCTLEGSTSTR
jgi:hypothetical protein